MDARPIGRDGEIEEICAFVSATSGTTAALVITGEAGIGKTVVWQHVIQPGGLSPTLLSCRPACAERPLTFSALNDLFSDVVAEVIPALPGPRRRAVETALLRDPSPEQPPTGRSKPGHALPERRVLAQGVLDALRILSGDSPLVVAIDDAQWLDRPSAGVLEFCFRRLQSEHVLIILTFRGDGTVLPLGLSQALPSNRLGHVQLGPLSLGAIGEILRSQLGATFPRYTLTRLYEGCGGNPFYALESARALASRPLIPATNEPLPIPRSLSDLVRRRVRGLTPEVRQVGRLVAASSTPRERVICATHDDGQSWAAIDQAIDEGIIERNGDALRFTHPLLRSALYGQMNLNERRKVHQRLGTTAEGLEDRAWHFALGADKPSEETAGMLDAAARHAASRGAPDAAAALAEQAIRLTVTDRSDLTGDRTVRAADYHFRAGDMARSRELIESMLPGWPAGSLRASLLLRLATIYSHQCGWPLAERTFRDAAREAREDPALRAHAEQELAFARLAAGDLPDACRWANLSLCSAEQSGDPRLVAHSMARIASFEFLQGQGGQLDLLDRAETLDASARQETLARLPLFGPSLIQGIVFKWCDRLDEARLRLAERHQYALDRGDEASLPFLLYHLSELECWAGNWDAAEEYALEGSRVGEETRQQTMTPATLYSLALVRAHRGQTLQAREIADQALDLCDRTGSVSVTWQVISVLGFIALSVDDYPAVHTHLAPLAEAISVSGLGEPSVVKFLPDEIEALIALGELDLARSFTEKLETQGRLLGRAWALATGARCRAQLAAIDGDLPGAQISCKLALSYHEQLPMPFELGRTLLTTGAVEWRARHKAMARDFFSQALAVFESLGAPLWAEKARRELSKIGPHPSADQLTGTERRVAALIAQGQTNRKVAAALFVTENTVQTHLRHIFQKLGVKSRTELAARLLAVSTGPAQTGQDLTITDRIRSALG